MGREKINKACPYLECIRSGCVCCEAGAKIGDGCELGRRFAKRFCQNEAGYRKCAVYLTALEAQKNEK